MQRLIDGVHRFQSDEFGRYQELFQRLSRDGQNPHTLFITCSDSRVLAELITHSRPGDLFVVKNVGNIVPHAKDQDSSSTSAAIEFAVEVLGVSDVVVCGHSQCGAMEALVNDVPTARNLEHVQRWLELAAPVREVVRTKYAHIDDRTERATAAAEENVLFGLENLHSHGCVQHRLAEGRLRLHGWFFKIATAELFAYDPRTGQFAQRIGGRGFDSGEAS
ncbi:MAG: carbonic anhydrase [Planctomycetes bacterium]|nr:carbonic anhydrase [Planctomycetota bacterium]